MRDGAGLRHLSLRVPWHDSGWDGTVCTDPKGNTSCLALSIIAELRDDAAEAANAGKAFDALDAGVHPHASASGSGSCLAGPTRSRSRCRMLDDPTYARRWAAKKEGFAKAGIIPWSPTNPSGRLIITEDGPRRGLDSAAIHALATKLWG